MDNLVDNAVKFTQKGRIDIIIDTVSKDSKKWNVIKVRDTGIGIPEESCKVIFQEFRQASEGTSRNFEGSGLGLTLAKKITEMMNGEISIESVPGKGSEFTLWFPAEENGASEVMPQICTGREMEKSPVANRVKPKILLVEDQLLNIQVTQLYLKSFSKLDYALTVEEALKMVQSKVYDAILMDIHLGIGMSGTQAAMEIRKIPEYAKVPIIACTGYAMLGDREKFIQEGFDEYIAKPFEKETLIQVFTSFGLDGK
jgi:CheY-like chemotaxis protein